MINRIVSSFLGFAELKAEKHIPLTMEDWEREFDKVIDLMDFRHLREHGQPRMEEAEQHALTEFQKYRIVQDRLYVSDYDRFTEGKTKQ